MWRSYKFRCYPTKAQEHLFSKITEDCRQLYNDALQDRRDGWKYQKRNVSRFDQYNGLPEILDDDSKLRARIYRTVFDDVLDRVDRAFRAFFKRCKHGEKPGFPRFKGLRRYSSFTYKASGYRTLNKQRIRLSKIGDVRYKPWLEELPSRKEVKTCTVKREADGWYVVLACDLPDPDPLPPTGHAVGVDVGLHTLAATNDGEFLGDLEMLKREERHLRERQRRLSNKKKGSHRRAKARQLVAKGHLHLKRKRKAQLDIISKKLVAENDILVFENLDVQQIANKAGKGQKGKNIRRAMCLASWSQLSWACAYKAASAGRRYLEVDPSGTSQECSECGQTVPKTLEVRIHECPCGCVLDRDVNAARNILSRGLQLLRSQEREDHLSNFA